MREYTECQVCNEEQMCALVDELVVDGETIQTWVCDDCFDDLETAPLPEEG